MGQLMIIMIMAMCSAMANGQWAAMGDARAIDGDVAMLEHDGVDDRRLGRAGMQSWAGSLANAGLVLRGDGGRCWVTTTTTTTSDDG